MKFLINTLLLSICLTAFPGEEIYAQDTLPNISISCQDGRISISWRNEYTRIANVINVQRSTDSLKNYNTIAEITNPQKKENYYIDVKPPYNNMFYRVFIAFEGGTYVFSTIKRPMNTGLILGESSISYPSKYVFTGKQNDLYISLPAAAIKKYKLKFFDMNYKLLFEVTKLTNPALVIEKVNFVHAGWFYFELYENGKLLEKNKFNIQAD